MGFFSDLFGGRKTNRDPYGTLNPEQTALTKKLGPYLTSQVNAPLQTYSGQLTEPISNAEQQQIDSFSRLNALRDKTVSDIIARGGENFDQAFTSEVANPTLDYFKREVQPLIEEALPTFSTARGTVVGRNLTNLVGDLAQKRFDARQAINEQTLRASSELSSAAATAQAIVSIPRELAQTGLDRKYADYLQANQNKQTSINQMLNFLGISTVTEHSEPSTFEELLGIGKSVAQILAGTARKQDEQEEDEQEEDA